MNTPLLTIAQLLLASLPLLAQAKTKPDSGSATAPPPDPVSLIADAEKLAKDDKEGAVMLLWEALDQLATQPDDEVKAAAVKAAGKLLAANDATDASRLLAFREVADKLVGIAKNYRVKKWYRTATSWLQVADQYDRAAGKAEHRRLAAKRKSTSKAKRSTAKKSKEPSLLRAGNMEFRSGAIQSKDGWLLAPATDGKSFLMEWVTKSRHADNELSIEYTALDPKASHTIALVVGQKIRPGSNNYSGIRATVVYEHGSYGLWLWEVRGMQVKQIGESGGGTIKPTDKPHRITVRVKGNTVRFQLDKLPPISATSDEPIRGFCGVVLSHPDIANPAIEIRYLRIDPLPEDLPTKEQIAQQETKRRQHRITTLVDEAKQLIAARKKEDAADKLREALGLTDELDKGILRETLEESIDEMLSSTDKLRKKTDAASVAIAEVIGALADQYVADGRPRLARMLMPRAMRFDPDGQEKRLAVIERKITDWNAEQAKARAAELLPPKDDGAKLREWFQGGKLLLSTKNPWKIAGPEATASELANQISYWMPTKTLTNGTFGAHVHVPTLGCQAGFCFDVVGPHANAMAVLSHEKNGLKLLVMRWASGKWIRLGVRSIKMDPWRIGGWHPITVKIEPAGVRIKACGKDVVVQRRDLGNPTGRIGLAGGNWTETPKAIGIRAFHVKQQ